MKHLEEYRDPDLSQKLVETIRRISRRPIRLMEVCGTHTMAIFRSGLRSLLPETITLLSGPGCPVCVTSQGEIDAFIALARIPDVIVATFGDLMRVPGSGSSLQREKAAGADVRVVYSTMDAVQIARQHPKKNIVFLGVGFETTAPTVAASVLAAEQMGVGNYSIYCAHKIVPPALAALMAQEGIRIDGFILPGHVSVIIGINAYRPFFDRHQIPCVVAGFEPLDLLQAISMLVDQIESDRPRLENAYLRAVTAEGNLKARAVMDQVFAVQDANWRGIGTIADSGLGFKQRYRGFDARQRFDIRVAAVQEPAGCACGQILTGIRIPPQCPLYKKLCTPLNPVGPCMVSSEGTCAAYYRYHG
jgi:hydrogenase expression/formation protein HypD